MKSATSFVFERLPPHHRNNALLDVWIVLQKEDRLGTHSELERLAELVSLASRQDLLDMMSQCGIDTREPYHRDLESSDTDDSLVLDDSSDPEAESLSGSLDDSD